MAANATIQDLRHAWERGFQIVAAQLNAVLAEQEPGLAIEAPAPADGSTAEAALSDFRIARGQLTHEHRRMVDDLGAAPWHVGYVNGPTNPPCFFPRSWYPAAELAQHVKCLQAINGWSKDGWRENIVAPIEAHAAKWRKFFRAVSRKKRRRQRTLPSQRPITAKEAEAVKAVSECNGNFAKAARQLGKHRATVTELYQSGMAKAAAVASHGRKLPPIDPHSADLGARQEHRPPRQRRRSAPDG